MTLEEAIAGKRVEIPFKFQVTEFPELQFIDDYCTTVFGNLDLEFELTNVGNIVRCMVDLLAAFNAEEWDILHYQVSGTPNDIYTALSSYKMNYSKEFTQVGDTLGDIEFPVQDTSNVSLGWHPSTVKTRVRCNSMILYRCFSTVFGYNVRDGVTKAIRDLTKTRPL